MKYLLIFLIFMSSCKVVEPNEQPVAVTVPQGDKILVTLGKDIGPSVNVEFAKKALNVLNAIYSNGCLEREFMSFKFKSLKNVDGAPVKSNAEAFGRLVQNAPYALDVRWYLKRLSKTIGYTYNYNGSKSETRIWSNTKYIYTPEGYAAHLLHELSHQARAGGFVHYTIFEGSVPYGLGDIADKCISALKE